MHEGASRPGGLFVAPRQSLLWRVVFVAEGRPVRWQEVVDYAKAVGLWADMLETVEQAAPGSAGDLREAQRSFRVERRLFAREDLDRWLCRWGLTTADWNDHLRRRRLAPPAEAAPQDEAGALVDAVCLGRLEQWARRLAERIAVAQPDETAGWAAVEAAFERAVAASIGEAELSREVAAHFYEWTSVACVGVQPERAEVAREIALCVADDGMAFAAAAAAAGLETWETEFRLLAASPELAAILMAGRPAEVLAPLEVGGVLMAVQIAEKRPPMLSDPFVAALAAHAAEARLCKQAAARRIEWRDLPA